MLSLYKHHYLIVLDVRLSNDAHTLCISLCLIQFGESSDIYRTHARPRINAVVKIILGRTLFEDLHYDRFTLAYGMFVSREINRRERS